MSASARVPVRPLGHCSACRANIFWAESTRGKAMPVDFEPTDGGNLVMTRRLDGVLVAMVVSSPEDMRGEPRFVSHFVTCPSAAHFRRARKRSGLMRST